jgi:hypothetical protein
MIFFILIGQLSLLSFQSICLFLKDFCFSVAVHMLSLQSVLSKSGQGVHPKVMLEMISLSPNFTWLIWPVQSVPSVPGLMV